MNDLISRQIAQKLFGEALTYQEQQWKLTWTTSEVKQWIADFIEDLPSAQPKMGKWIYHIDDLFPAESTMECNQCHAEQPLTCDDEFCPHCGAKMEVTE